MRVLAVAAVVAMVSAPVLGVSPACAGDDPQLAAQGRQLFEDRGCYGCHRVSGTGGTTGPDLTNVGSRYSRSYLSHWLRDGPYRGAIHMPKIELTEPERQALEAYLVSLRWF